MDNSQDLVTFSYPADEDHLLSFVRSEVEEAGRNLLITGAIGSGKSTFVQHFIDYVQAVPAGYMTIRHVDPEEKTLGFAHRPAANQAGTGFLTVRHEGRDDFPAASCFLLVDDKGRRFDLEAFARGAVELIDRPGTLVILDELGGDELLQDHFYNKILSLLEASERPLILVWKQDASLERSIGRSGLTGEEKDLLRLRRKEIFSHPSLTRIELENDSQSAAHRKRTLWGSAAPQADRGSQAPFPEDDKEGQSSPAADRGSRRMAFRFAIMGGTLLFILLASFAVGWYGISLSTIVRFFWSQIWGGGGFPDEIHTVLINVRMPRILMGLLVGSGLSVAGHTFQGVFRNPMASPDVLGASSGAGFGAALAILWGLPASGITGFSFLFGLLSIGLVLLLTSFVRAQRVLALILTGIVVSSLFSAGLSLIKLAADPTNQLPAITYWLMGSLNASRLKDLIFAAPVILGGALVIFLLRWQLNVLAIGEEAATSMGVRIRLVRVALILAATLITAASVSVSGVIGWVGLVVPHIARMLTGSDNRYSLPASALIGSAFMILVDTIARRASTSGIPLGILTAFVGAPFFVYLILRQGRKDVAA